MANTSPKPFNPFHVPFYSVGNVLTIMFVFIILSLIGDIASLIYPELIVEVTPAHLITSIITTIVLGIIAFAILLFIAAQLDELHDLAHEFDEDDEDIERIEIAVVMLVEPKPDNAK